MEQKTQSFQSVNFIFWSLMALLTLAVAMPAKAMSTDEIRKIIAEEAAKTDVPSSLALAVVKTESNFRTDHEGRDGARGLMQILPETAKNLGLNPRHLWQIRPNLRAGLSILEGLLQRTEGRWDEAIKAYGSHRRPFKSVNNQRYVTAVLETERQFAEQLMASNSLSGPAPEPVSDEVSERRREVLAGYDNWASEPQIQDQVAQTEPANPDQRGHQASEPPEIKIVRGNRVDEVEIIIIETKSSSHDLWQPPSRPVFQRRDWPPRAHPHARWNPRFNRAGRRFSRQFQRGGHRPFARWR